MGFRTLSRRRILSIGFVLLCAFFFIHQIRRTQALCIQISTGEQLRASEHMSKSKVEINRQGGRDIDNFSAIRNSTLGFQKILVLGLPERFDKKDVWSLAAMASDLEIEWVEGIRHEDITAKARPAGWSSKNTDSTLGSYRGHMNAVRRIIDEKMSTVLILEDDVEWDVMIRHQLVEFARGVRYIQQVADPSSLHSPYGDDWDLLLIGHCAARSRPDVDSRYWVIHNDPTVTPRSMYRWAITSKVLYPDTSPPELQGNFTRLIYEPRYTRCTYGYAMSLRGAKKFLYHFSIEPNAKMMDYAVSDFCSAPKFGAKCMTVYPNLIDQYRPAGPTLKDSDRKDTQDEVEMREHGEAINIVFPRKASLRNYIDSSEVYESQWPNESLWPRINPTTDKLPLGEGIFLTKDKFDGHS